MKQIRIEVDCTVCGTWVEIDAVQLRGKKHMSGKLSYGKCSKSWLQKRSRQTVQTQIRLLLKKQSDQALPCLLC